jgi:ABC-type uncharacterized transport system permease subunit
VRILQLVLFGVAGALFACGAAFLVVFPYSADAPSAYALTVTVASGAAIGLVVGAIWRKEELRWLVELLLNA